jgi:hypothetical protein
MNDEELLVTDLQSDNLQCDTPGVVAEEEQAIATGRTGRRGVHERQAAVLDDVASLVMGDAVLGGR